MCIASIIESGADGLQIFDCQIRDRSLWPELPGGDKDITGWGYIDFLRNEFEGEPDVSGDQNGVSCHCISAKWCR